jgi:AIG2-like family
MISSSVKRVATLFYGSFIRPDVMSLAGIESSRVTVAKLSGYDICFDPHANIFRSEQHSIYGVLVHATHEELNRLYRRDGVGEFLPEAVLVEIDSNKLLPALCFVPPLQSSAQPDRAYVELIVKAGRTHGFPSWYLSRLGRFLEK